LIRLRKSENEKIMNLIDLEDKFGRFSMKVPIVTRDISRASPLPQPSPCSGMIFYAGMHGPTIHSMPAGKQESVHESFKFTSEEMKMAKDYWNSHTTPWHNCFEYLGKEKQMEVIVLAYRELLHKTDTSE
jgi:hypothetical protein